MRTLRCLNRVCLVWLSSQIMSVLPYLKIYSNPIWLFRRVLMAKFKVLCMQNHDLQIKFNDRFRVGYASSHFLYKRNIALYRNKCSLFGNCLLALSKIWSKNHKCWEATKSPPEISNKLYYFSGFCSMFSSFTRSRVILVLIPYVKVFNS